MENAVTVAQVLGPLYLVTGAALFANPEAMRRLVDDLEGNAAQSFLWGFFTLAAGLVILALYDVWSADWAVIITLMGWLGAIKGAVLLIAPGIVVGFSRAFLSPPSRIKLWAAGPMGLGLFLSFKSFGMA
ncbi:MAG: hypothetical protein MI741_11005 [Rhodospirillales bacterium]|nr:hypothetical protein [Rhodospirillales bacterium]